MKRTFTRDELEELDIPDDPEFEVYRCQTDSGRWHSSHELVFRTEADGPMWLVRYQKPLTEMQDCDLWFGWPTVGAVQVEPYEATVVKYRPVEAAEERSDTTPMNLDPGEPADLTYRQ